MSETIIKYMAHDPKCQCYSGNHIWDLDYEKENKTERYCLCCEHFFPTFTSHEAELDDMDSLIEFNSPGITYNNEPAVINKGISKGKVVRRG